MHPDNVCYCCGMHLCKNDTEWHHFPLSKINGGSNVIPLCTTCHNHIDRINLSDFDESFADDIYKIMLDKNRHTRIFILKMVSIMNICVHKDGK